MAKALLVVDVQVDFCEGGSLPVEGGNEVAERIAAYLEQQPEYLVIFYTKDWHLADSDNGGHIALPPAKPDYVDTWPAHCLQNSIGAEFQSVLRDYYADHPGTIFYKGMGEPAYSGFEGTSRNGPLATMLAGAGIAQVDVCGLAADYCVKDTALHAIQHGYDTKILENLTAGIHQSPEMVAEEIAGLNQTRQAYLRSLAK